MRRIWLLRTAGIICIIAGAFIVVRISLVIVIPGIADPTPPHDPIAYFFGVIFSIPSIPLGTVAIIGGIYALRRDIWGLALAGSIALVGFAGYGLFPIFLIDPVVFVIAGILSTIFVALGRGQFGAKLLARDVSPKSRLATASLAFFLGVFGAHRFYIGRIITGIVMLLLCIAGWAIIWLAVTGDMVLVSNIFFTAVAFVVAVWMWAFVDFIVAVAGDMTDKEGRLIRKW